MFVISSRSNQLLLGVILLLLGLFAIGQNLLNINYGNITFLAVGFAFLLLYKTKRKTFALIIGVYLMYIGLASIPFISRYSIGLFSAMFFLVPGIIFLILYYDKNKRELLIPGAILFWIGAFTILRSLGIFNFITHNTFFLCLSCGFFTIYFLGQWFLGKWPLYVAIILLIMNVLQIVKFRFNLSFLKLSPYLGGIVLIILSIFIIVRAVKKEK